jgi:hypothetical protein
VMVLMQSVVAVECLQVGVSGGSSTTGGFCDSVNPDCWCGRVVGRGGVTPESRVILMGHMC